MKLQGKQEWGKVMERPEVLLHKEREELVRPMGASGGAGVGGGELTSQDHH